MEYLVKLFEPLSIKTMELKNRIVMPPLCTRMAGLTGGVTKQLIDYYVERARGGVGLILVEATVVDTKLGKDTLIMLSIDRDIFVPGLHELVEAIHLEGASVGLQLAHGGGQISFLETLEGNQPVSASNVYFPRSDVSARTLTIEEIETLVGKFGEAARRAKNAGFDCVEIHGAHGYLINEFLSPYTNKRTDKYGGDPDRRMRLALEIIERIREKVDDNFPLFFRISADEFVEGGLTLRDAKDIAKKLKATGLDALDVSAGIGETAPRIIQPMALPRGCLVHLAEGIKKVVDIPVIAVGRINDPSLAEKILQEGKADLVAMGRALIADPELPKKAREGRLDDIRKCIACNQGCVPGTHNFSMRCAVNAAVGREREYTITNVQKPKRVVVVGGGPAGMEAARVLALRGHEVILYEMEGRLGGQLVLAKIPPHKEEIGCLIEYLTHQVEKLGVEIRLSQEATPQVVERTEPDAVIVATGAAPIVPKILGVNRENVVTTWDVLRREANVGNRVVVVGGGEIGCETAEFLAEGKKKVTIITRRPASDLAIDMETFGRELLLERLTKLGIDVLDNVDIEEITDKDVTIINKSWKRQIIEADTVVFARGSIANRKLFEALRGKVPEIYMIGDCVKPRKILEAVHEGSHVARRI